MSADLALGAHRKARNFPFYRTLPRLIRDPLREIEEIGRISDGELVRIDFGVFRAHVATHPDHVQQVLRDPETFRRDGTFWQPLHRLFGDSILGEHEPWDLSRRTLNPIFTARHIAGLADRMAETIREAVDQVLAGPARDGRPVPIHPAMSEIVNRTILKVFFGDKISEADNDRLAPAFESIATAVAFRFLLPFLPDAVPVPGDRAFRQSVRTIDEILYPLVRRHRERDDGADDFFSVLCRARTAEGGEVTDRWVRDNLVSLFATATETTAGALTWLWPLLDYHPEVAARLQSEIDEAVGDAPIQAAHLGRLGYTRQVVQELLRLYPVGWLFPRRAATPAVVGGVALKTGDTVLLSPFLTHRLPSVWPDPLAFDPDRFAKSVHRRHRYAYYPFGGGPHQCIGMHVFNAEAELIIAGVLSRFRPVSCTDVPTRPRIGATLRPREIIEVLFTPDR